MTPMVYNVPIEFADKYRGKRMIVRSHEPSRIVQTLVNDLLTDVVGIQLMLPAKDIDSLSQWGYSIPIEVVMRNPDHEFILLYQFAKLLDKHPMWVSIPVVEGLIKAVKLAASLHFGIKLEVGQPSASAIAELSKALEFFLHNSLVSHPIQFFYGMLLTELDQGPATLWDIQEEDPAVVRYISNDGRQTVARQPENDYLIGDLSTFVDDFKSRLHATGAECLSCEFFANCAGYFKWPIPEYQCDGIKVVFRNLKRAAADLRNDLAAASQQKAEIKQ